MTDLTLKENEQWLNGYKAGYAQAQETDLSQPEQKPVAWVSHNAGLYHGKPDESLNPLPLYLAPPRREWVGLTDEDIAKNIYVEGEFMLPYSFARSIEAMLKDKNNAD